MSFLGISTEVPSLGDLAGSVGALVDSVIGDLLDTITGDTKYAKLYKQEESTFKQYSEEQADRRKWHTIPVDRTSPSYSFLLKYRGKVIQVPFNINPQRETITEPHANTITYTQGGGKVSNSDGSISKEITIQGTCGLYPGERRKRLPDSGIGSGFEAFKMLQNVFRKYTFLKRFGDLSSGLQLIYVNRRRQEAWVVEPKSFTSEDAVEHNFVFNYTISLETLYPYDGSETKSLMEQLFDSIPGWRQADAIIQRLSETVDVANASVGQISAIVDGFQNTIWTRVMSLTNSFADVKAGRLSNVANFKRDSIKDTVRSLRETAAALEAAGEHELAKKVMNIERDMLKTLLIDNVYSETPQTSAVSTTTTQNRQVANFQGSDGSSVSPEDAIAAGAVTARPDATEMLGGKATSPAALPGTATKQAQDKATSDKSVSTISTVGGAALDTTGKFQVARFTSEAQDSQAIPPSTRDFERQLNWDASWDQALNNIDPSVSNYRTAIVHVDDSIQTLAYRLLGDHARWPELVLLNNLRHPYVAEQNFIFSNNLTNVIPWGGYILYPVAKTTPESRVRVWRNESAESLALDPAERALGNDIMVDAKTGDVVWTANDLALVYGVNNLEQFLRKRSVVRKGTLRRAIRLGLSHYIGLSSGVTEALVRAEVPALFVGDERIIAAEVLKAEQVAQNLLVAIAVTVKDIQDPIVVTTRV